MPDYIRFNETNSDPNLVVSQDPGSESDSGAFAGSDSKRFGRLELRYMYCYLLCGLTRKVLYERLSTNTV